ncbi:hypothetical protein CDL15_Pgr029175 [Punica granatum]|nr:hypothetical protein CDL15_Pgr029175 [Punica granatum]
MSRQVCQPRFVEAWWDPRLPEDKCSILLDGRYGLGALDVEDCMDQILEGNGFKEVPIYPMQAIPSSGGVTWSRREQEVEHDIPYQDDRKTNLEFVNMNEPLIV